MKFFLPVLLIGLLGLFLVFWLIGTAEGVATYILIYSCVMAISYFKKKNKKR